MKLLTRYNRVTMMVTVAIMIMAGIVYYFTIGLILTRQIDRALLVEENEIRDYVALNRKLPQVFRTNHQEISFSPAQAPILRRFTDTVYRDFKEKELEPARALHTAVEVNRKLYRILVVQSTVETEDLLEVIFFITLGLIAALLTALLFLSRVILSHIWKPFYQNLLQIRHFNPADNKSITTVPSSTDEFMELNQAVGAMADRVNNDYQTLKAFTENASHELMTPISVINSKLDTLLQTGEFTDTQSQLLADIYGTVTRLTRLNKSMLLLTKIENRLITDNQPINLKALVAESLKQYEELINGLNLTLQANLIEVKFDASLLLMEVLVQNLIGNAIRHNYPGGFITMKLDKQSWKISNSGAPNQVIPAALFIRFEKSATSEGTGLGLTICKQICGNYGFDLTYNYTDQTHHFTVIFAP